jgi:hypothetical protein
VGRGNKPRPSSLFRRPVPSFHAGAEGAHQGSAQNQHGVAGLSSTSHAGAARMRPQSERASTGRLTASPVPTIDAKRMALLHDKAPANSS